MKEVVLLRGQQGCQTGNNSSSLVTFQDVRNQLLFIGIGPFQGHFYFSHRKLFEAQPCHFAKHNQVVFRPKPKQSISKASQQQTKKGNKEPRLKL